MNKEKLQDISDKAHSINVANGFKEVSRKRSLALIIGELAEMLEADRKGKWSKNLIADLVNRESNLLHGMTIEQAHKFIIENDVAWFKETVKDTAEDELADVVIRITSCLAACGYKMQIDCVDVFDALEIDTFDAHVSELIFEFMRNVAIHGNDNEELEYTAHACFAFAKHLGIDLEWHIEAKLNYNKTRPYLHGKTY